MILPTLSKNVLDRAAVGELKAYCYDKGFCVSAVSLEAARRYISELLPWPHNEKDAGLVSQIADSELDARMHFYWDTKEEDEVSCAFRREIERRMEQGETEPNTFYDQMCLIPDTPSYGVHA